MSTFRLGLGITVAGGIIASGGLLLPAAPAVGTGTVAATGTTAAGTGTAVAGLSASAYTGRVLVNTTLQTSIEYGLTPRDQFNLPYTRASCN